MTSQLTVMGVDRDEDHYRVRFRDADEFTSDGTVEDPARFCLRYAILTLSSHNSQPWTFEVDGNEISIPAGLFDALTTRPTSHEVYDGRPLEDETRARLEAAVDSEDVTLRVVDGELKAAIAELQADLAGSGKAGDILARAQR